MARSTVQRLASLVVLLAVTSSAKDQGRWSRQISTYTADISDWVPLSGPTEREQPQTPASRRQAVAEPRILSEPFTTITRPSGFGPEIFPSRTYYNAPANRQLYLQSVPTIPSAPQNFLTDQGFGHSIRFGLSQPNFPLNQGFISQQFGYDSVPQITQQRPQVGSSNPIKFENFPKPTPSQVPVPTQIKPFLSQPQKIKPDVPKFIDGYRVENASDFSYNQRKKPQSLQKIKFDNYEKPVSRPEVPQNIPKTYNQQQNSQKIQKEVVQLLYVPLESLNRGQFNYRSPIQAPNSQINTDLYSKGVPTPVKKSMIELHRPIQKTIDNVPLQNYFTAFNSQLKDNDQVPKFSTITSPFPTILPTTPKPKKLKPHQPPLAIFLTEKASRSNQIKVADVLASLKNANSVPVLDSVNPLNAPEVFIGPSSLQPPERFVKFELPYLSNIENSDKKLRQLPFFVAPLSYNTPQGFAKIPFPSPHVGSVVINSQIKETSSQTPSTENFTPNYYTVSYRPEQRPATQKPTISYYSTAAPRANPASNPQSNYYQFEPQTVSTLRTLNELQTEAPIRPGNYFISNTGAQYNPQQYNFAPKTNYQQQPEPAKTYTVPKQETTTTQKTTVSTTTKLPVTYPSQLLETHNPYSINQAFHFSTPLDYQSYVEDYKQPLVTPSEQVIPVSVSQQPSSTSPSPKVEEVVTERQRYQTSPDYLQSYSPEIHYNTEAQAPRYPQYNNNNNDYTTKIESSVAPIQIQSSKNENNLPANNPSEYINKQDIPVLNSNSDDTNRSPDSIELENPANSGYNQYETNFDSNEPQSPSTTSTTSTTTRKTPLRGRGRPRYTTTPRSDSSEYSTRTAATRRPLRERRPLPTRARYEPNKITTEKPTRKPTEYSEESSTKSIRTRTRGRVTYRPSEENYDRRKTHNSKEQDLAYQRDVLHQNYPVTIQERMSTVDIEAITEPAQKHASNKELVPVTETYDTENAYTYERASISHQIVKDDSNEDIPVFPTRTTVSQPETSYVPRLSTRNDEYMYPSRSSLAPIESLSYDEATTDRNEDLYLKQNTSGERLSVSFATDPTTIANYEKEQNNSENNKEEETTTTAPASEVTKEINQEEEENVVQTTPSYNRVRVRPGVIRQYHQASTEFSKTDKRMPVTYRPAFDRRRTTMRIDEIQADLKTKQIHGRPEVDEHRHPVYKPEPSTEATSTKDTTTKRGQYRRRRPSYSYTTTSTEGSITRKNTYDVKNRFRGRRPTTEKPTDKTEISTDTSTTTVRPLYSRYSNRPRLSERYNKRPEPEETNEDQDSNYSINMPKYAEPETDQWSIKTTGDSFKPYNPNNIEDEEKVATTERRSDKIEMDIITARNDYDDVLISVTPASNNRNQKKIPDIPPTLEALVEQSKVTKSDTGDNMSTFESMLEEVMKSLEEQDEHEYSSNVMKHKGGEIGEIPPERIISSGDNYNTKQTTPIQNEATTVEPDSIATTLVNEEENESKTRRRGFWKKVKVRPVAAESIEAAESQYYSTTVNRLGQPQQHTKSLYDKSNYEKKVTVTTYKPTIQFKDVFSDDITSPNEEVLPTMEISKLNSKTNTEEDKSTTVLDTQTENTNTSPGDLDLGTGSPDPTIDELYNTPTEPTSTEVTKSEFSLMDYLFGVTSDDKTEIRNETTTETQVETTTESAKSTESTYVPDEITEAASEINTEAIDIKKINSTEAVNDVRSKVESKLEMSTQSSYMDPLNIVSTSMSTEISHETEICFRGKCIKTFKDVL